MIIINLYSALYNLYGDCSKALQKHAYCKRSVKFYGNPLILDILVLVNA